MIGRMMIVKIPGVAPRQLTLLHRLLADPERDAHYHHTRIPSENSDQRRFRSEARGHGASMSVKLLASKLVADQGTYTVELQVPINGVSDPEPKIDGARTHVFMPQAFVASVFEALELYPEDDRGELRREGDAFLCDKTFVIRGETTSHTTIYFPMGDDTLTWTTKLEEARVFTSQGEAKRVLFRNPPGRSDFDLVPRVVPNEKE